MLQNEKTGTISAYKAHPGIRLGRSDRTITEDLAEAEKISGEGHSGRIAEDPELQIGSGRNADRTIKGANTKGFIIMIEKILSIISVLALIEFIAGAVLVEGGAFGLGILAMVMPLAWFGLILLMSSMNERRNEWK